MHVFKSNEFKTMGKIKNRNFRINVIVLFYDFMGIAKPPKIYKLG